MIEAVIVEGIRTAVGRRNGALKGKRPDELAADVLSGLVKKAGISADLVEDVILGCVTQSGEQAANIARTAALIAGFPIEVPGTTIDRQCGSSQQAIHFAAQSILAGDMDIVIAGGVENMSRVPMGSNMKGASISEKLKEKFEVIHQGISAERIAKEYNLTRKDLDEFAVQSHQRALKAQAEGYFMKEILPIDILNEEGNVEIFNQDSGPRQGTSLEKLAVLSPSFLEDGMIHAGNASQISDGAAAVLIMSRSKALELGVCYYQSSNLSIIVAFAIPLPSHMVCNPYRPPFLSSSCIILTINLAPLAPRG